MSIRPEDRAIPSAPATVPMPPTQNTTDQRGEGGRPVGNSRGRIARSPRPMKPTHPTQPISSTAGSSPGRTRRA